MKKSSVLRRTIASMPCALPFDSRRAAARMAGYLRCVFTASILAVALQSGIGLAQPTFQGAITPPPMPSEIQVAAGNVPFLKGEAVGTQNFICMPVTAGFAWTFTGPQATLFVKFKWLNQDVQQQVTTHFLSPNTAENGTPRATWQSSFDSSKVWAKSIASSSDPIFVAPGAIPWLRLEVVGAGRGPTGGAFLTQTSFIQRLNTSGGLAPSSGCSQATHAGTTAFVPYTADYYFYRAGREN